MIRDGFMFVAFILFMGAVVVGLEKRSKTKFFNYVPAIVLIYFLTMVFSTLGVWEQTDSVKFAVKSLKDNLLPAMIFLMLLKCDLREIAKLGPKMIIGFFSASISIGIGFIVSYGIFKSSFPADTWKSFAALAGSWFGGTGNMAAVQGALNVSDASMGYTLLIDSIDYSIWVLILLALVPFAHVFNKWTKADASVLDEVGKRLEENSIDRRKDIQFTDLIILLGSSLLVSAVSQSVGALLPETSFLTSSTWTVMIATVFGIVLAMTSLGELPGSSEVSNVMLYLIVGLIASSANFRELSQAPLYIIAGMVILLVHGLLMIVMAKIFKLDLFTCGVASLANIGGVASAPILAAAYSEVLIPIGVLMALLGYMVGTGGGLLIARILSMM